MQYFIPAWYQENDWRENEQVWYRSRTVTEFDDTVKQVQLFFRRKVAPLEVVLLSFSPNFRHFLHRQGVYHVPYWSCFDAMQGISVRAMHTFSFHDLSWPEDVEFVYSPFAVLVMHNREKYAEISFAEDGNMFRVDLFRNGLMSASNFYDDRGFVSQQIAYENGVASFQRYFDEQGVWKFARYLEDGHVVINPESAFFLHGNEKVPYAKQRYQNLDEVIAEVLADFLKDTSEEDVFTIAMHPLHSELLNTVLKERPKILSFFERRMEAHAFTEAEQELLDLAGCIVADKQSTAEEVKKHLHRDTPIRVITPYETRVEFGISQHLHVQNILAACDDLSEEQFDRMIVLLGGYIRNQNHRARVCLFTRSSKYDEKIGLLKRAQNALSRAGMNPEMAGTEEGVRENDALEDPLVRVFSVAQCVDEMHVSRTLREQRVVCDLSPLPDQFLEISAMSMGIPQITMQKTEYIEDGRNGKILKDLSELPEAADYYLGSVAHFNEAQIASYDLGSRFTAPELEKAWKEVIQIDQHSGTAAGRE